MLSVRDGGGTRFPFAFGVFCIALRHHVLTGSVVACVSCVCDFLFLFFSFSGPRALFIVASVHSQTRSALLDGCLASELSSSWFRGEIGNRMHNASWLTASDYFAGVGITCCGHARCFPST